LPYRATAFETGLLSTVIHEIALLEITGLSLTVDKIAQGAAACLNRFSQRATNRCMQARIFRRAQIASRPTWRNACTK
jgi:hypothetical protein